jgi:hypothetical protein
MVQAVIPRSLTTQHQARLQLQLCWDYGEQNKHYTYNVAFRRVRVRRIILSSVAYAAARYSSRLPHNRQDFREKVTVYKNVCSGFLYNFCLKHVSF